MTEPELHDYQELNRLLTSVERDRIYKFVSTYENLCKQFHTLSSVITCRTVSSFQVPSKMQYSVS